MFHHVTYFGSHVSLTVNKNLIPTVPSATASGRPVLVLHSNATTTIAVSGRAPIIVLVAARNAGKAALVKVDV